MSYTCARNYKPMAKVNLGSGVQQLLTFIKIPCYFN